MKYPSVYFRHILRRPKKEQTLLFICVVDTGVGADGVQLVGLANILVVGVV